MERPFRNIVLTLTLIALAVIVMPVTAQDGYPITTPTPTITRTPWLETSIPAPRTPTPTPNNLLPPCHYLYIPLVIKPSDGTTPTPVPTATSSAAQPKPICESGFYVLSSGDKMTIPNVVTYGDIARVIAVGGLIVTVLLLSLIRVPKLWLQ